MTSDMRGQVTAGRGWLHDIIEATADAHEPYEGSGGIIECTCGYTSRAAFLAHGEGWIPESFQEHIIGSFLVALVAPEEIP